MNYPYLLFDLDNTILDFDQSKAHALATTCAHFGIPLGPREKDLYTTINTACWAAYERGEMDQPTLRYARFERFLSALNWHSSPAREVADFFLHELGQTRFEVNGAVDMLERLKPDFRMALVTNGLKDVQRSRLHATGLGRFFEEIIISEEINVAKPQHEFFAHTHRLLGHPPKSELLIIGDSLSSDIRGGHDFGIATCWYNPQRKALPPTHQPTFDIQHIREVEWIARQR